ncbi:Rrf2 family transcriptional regulator [Microvirga tunisiensis]|uniref:Rrf2 family transcriptional regulator n=2 Tax=Pannonibacter tanglangensis TaxID=2750084 RepID=A0ABW9ZI03_9HYPH|nr:MULTISPECIES: Rrf2 family transcriptional regulator [unclassified Pannonibacter]NBN64493.1 Rrf2 family transcriptional regulator [Pannonibacter sp. XCT-34]NBN79025.1 Rrf2 family transcriptional regulator [Pannonibacter sp. XCT-53]
MRLSQASDFALRILVHLGQTRTPQTVEGLSVTLGLSKSHVMKIVAHLGRAGILATSRGRGGGLTLRKDPAEIRLGAVVREMEPDLGVVACLQDGPADCVFLPRCALKSAMARATNAFIDSLDSNTLADVLPGTQPARPAAAPLPPAR